jgi:hypothetical protein
LYHQKKKREFTGILKEKTLENTTKFVLYSLLKYFEHSSNKTIKEMSTVVHICKPSYLGGRRISSLRQAYAKKC